MCTQFTPTHAMHVYICEHNMHVPTHMHAYTYLQTLICTSAHMYTFTPTLHVVYLYRVVCV